MNFNQNNNRMDGFRQDGKQTPEDKKKSRKREISVLAFVLCVILISVLWGKEIVLHIVELIKS